MARKRNTPDPWAAEDLRWLTVSTMSGELLEVRELHAGLDRQGEFRLLLARLDYEGWKREDPERRLWPYCVVTDGKERRQVNLSPAAPGTPMKLRPAWKPGETGPPVPTSVRTEPGSH